MTISLDVLALTAAKKAFKDTIDRTDLVDVLGMSAEDIALNEAIQSYLITAHATGATHELSIIPGGVPGYEPLAEVLQLAFEQSAKGKGRQRHGHGKPFTQQPIFNISRMVGLAGLTYQIMKKAQEATNMDRDGKPEAAQAELLGVMVYAAAAHILIKEEGK